MLAKLQNKLSLKIGQIRLQTMHGSRGLQELLVPVLNRRPPLNPAVWTDIRQRSASAAAFAE